MTHPKFKPGDHVTFRSSDSARRGLVLLATVISLLTEDDADLRETGPMYQLKTQDGSVEDAFEDELEAIPAPRLCHLGEGMNYYALLDTEEVVFLGEFDEFPQAHDKAPGNTVWVFSDEALRRVLDQAKNLLGKSA